MATQTAERPALRGIERRSIDWVPDDERHGKLWHQAPLWFLGNFQYFSIPIGFIGPSLGLSLGWTIVAGALGILFGTIFMAFHAAHAADPDALLTYNDWGCEQGGAVNDRFRATTLKFLDGLLDRGVPVQALGLQSHLAAFGPHVDQRKLRDFLREIEARRLAILVTELDVDDSGGPSDTALRDQAVADEARRFLDVVLDSPATRAVVTWGLSDRYLDPPDDWKLRLMGWHGRTLPYDAQLKRKPLWAAIAQSFQSRRTSY